MGASQNWSDQSRKCDYRCVVAVNNYLAESASYPQLAAAEEKGEYSSCDEALIRFFEQGENQIETSAVKQYMIQGKKEEEKPNPIPTPQPEKEKNSTSEAF